MFWPGNGHKSGGSKSKKIKMKHRRDARWPSCGGVCARDGGDFGRTAAAAAVGATLVRLAQKKKEIAIVRAASLCVCIATQNDVYLSPGFSLSSSSRYTHGSII